MRDGALHPPEGTIKAGAPDVGQQRGFLLGLGAYLLWGFFPLYWPLLRPAGPVEILAHSVVWSLVTVVVLIVVARGWAQVRAVLADRRRLLFICAGSVTIGVNWGVYIYGVNSGQVVETSLGYFITPLLTILLGVVVLGERPRPWQWAGLAIALAAVVELTIDYGRLPWIALILAFSFGTYSLTKKKADVGSTEGLALETLLLAPIALTFLLTGDGGTFGEEGWLKALLFAGTGVLTAIPLLMFGAAVTKVPLTTLGLLQYTAPTMQLLCGIIVFHEHMTTARWIGFGLVWLALVVITTESLLTRRKVTALLESEDDVERI